MDRTQWLRTYQNVQHDILRVLAHLPNRRIKDNHIVSKDPSSNSATLISPKVNEQKLSLILGAMDCLLDRCEKTVNHTSRHILTWLQSTSQTMQTRRTFSLVAKPSSLQRYRRLWKCFIAFIFQACHLPAEVRRDLLGDRIQKALHHQILRLASNMDCYVSQLSDNSLRNQEHLSGFQ